MPPGSLPEAGGSEAALGGRLVRRRSCRARRVVGDAEQVAFGICQRRPLDMRNFIQDLPAVGGTETDDPLDFTRPGPPRDRKVQVEDSGAQDEVRASVRNASRTPLDRRRGRRRCRHRPPASHRSPPPRTREYSTGRSASMFTAPSEIEPSPPWSRRWQPSHRPPLLD